MITDHAMLHLCMILCPELYAERAKYVSVYIVRKENFCGYKTPLYRIWKRLIRLWPMRYSALSQPISTVFWQVPGTAVFRKNTKKNSVITINLILKKRIQFDYVTSCCVRSEFRWVSWCKFGVSEIRLITLQTDVNFRILLFFWYEFGILFFLLSKMRFSQWEALPCDTGYDIRLHKH